MPLRRLFYSPEVYAYIKPLNGAIIDISNDIIEGNITRKTEDVSTLRLVVQNRRSKEGTSILAQKIRPMDQIIVYLKKVKPVLVFSGYLDLVPFFQAVPEPVTIEASCTLKRLEFTYWDPNLPHVREVLTRFGLVPLNVPGDQGSAYGVVPGNRITGKGQVRDNQGNIQDTGFGAMLYFLLQEVGKWPKEKIWIEPIPAGWTERATVLYKQAAEENKFIEDNIINLYKELIGESGTSDGGGYIGGGPAKLGDLTEAQTTGLKAIVQAANEYNVDPIAMTAVSLRESNLDPKAIGDSGNSVGLFQLNIKGAGAGLSVKQRQDALFNARFAARHLAELKEKFKPFRPIPQAGKVGPQVAYLMTVHFEKPENAEAKGEHDKTIGYPKAKKLVEELLNSAGGGAFLDEKRARKSGKDNTASFVTDTVAAAARGEDVKNRISVYLEAGHAPGDGGSKMQPGYQKQTGAGEVAGGSEYSQNAFMVNKIGEYIKNTNVMGPPSPEYVALFEKTDTSRPGGWQGDVYISIHHDPATYNQFIGIGSPHQDSIADGDSHVINKGKQEPNQYDDGGTGFYLPGGQGGGRLKINEDKGLIQNSNKLVQLLKEEMNKSGELLVELVGQEKPRMNNYYGFYYSNAKACAIIELPSTEGELRYDRDKMGEAIARAIHRYRIEWAGKGLQKEVNDGYQRGTKDKEAESAGGKGDDSKASKLIKILLKTIKDNEINRMIDWELGGGHTPSSISLRKAYLNGINLDCSGFILSGMIDAGLRKVGDREYTGSFYAQKEKEVENKEENLVAGMLLVDPDPGASGHIGIYIGHGKVAESSSSGGLGVVSYSKFSGANYKAIIHSDIGTTTDPPTGDSIESGLGIQDQLSLMKNIAFNIEFNFPGNQFLSVALTGERALENDVKLLETVAEVCKASMRTFSSTPQGDFIAWYPDYFNISGRNPRWVISTAETIKCTISLSDKNLATHVYIIGSPFGQPSAIQGPGEIFNILRGAGVVTLERPWILDSFLRRIDNRTKTKKVPKTSRKGITAPEGRTRPLLEGQGAVLKFLERYGARPYVDKPLTIRSNLFEFFYAYHTFIQKWAEQYISEVQLTFMPELLPGFIIELEQINATFYVKEVTHSFSYESGFYTNATLIAPGTTDGSSNFGMVLVQGTKSLNPGYIPSKMSKPAKIKPKLSPDNTKTLQKIRNLF